ncbi:Na/Pi cotransporter family protein [Thalassotalea aquiviva]|uniref:Na/Pi cotransporter family protein n=1 Tax=Thalassotalea aquiviva TaxID=3242415 RepID=UPI00352BBE68
MEILTTVGGLGLFLLGMVIMTQGLKELAGQQIKNILAHLTKTPLSAVTFGALCTALMQSSSATTLAAVGFVAAEIITFTSSLGIIIGANLGTTITGWLVALLGFKFKIGILVFPFIFFGALLKLVAKGQLSHLGFSIAGFGLVFLGINHMQLGMEQLQAVFSFDGFPGDTWFSRIQLIVFGILFTIVTQSSSAGIAATLTALNADFIVFEQAAALAIGMDIGTTATAALATVGGSINSKRTGFSHVIYNVLTAIMAFFLISPFIAIITTFFPTLLTDDSEIALVIFHSGFNFLGVLLVLPFTHHFAHLMQTLIVAKPHQHNRFLDESLLQTPDLALLSVRKSLRSHTLALLHSLQDLLKLGSSSLDLSELQTSLNECHDYIDRIHLTPSKEQFWAQLIHSIHLIDHLQRLHERCEEDRARAITASQWQGLTPFKQRLKENICDLQLSLQHEQLEKLKTVSNNALALSEQVNEFRLQLRQQVTEDIGKGALSVSEGTQILEAIRWFNRVCYHLHRISDRMYTLESLNTFKVEKE